MVDSDNFRTFYVGFKFVFYSRLFHTCRDVTSWRGSVTNVYLTAVAVRVYLLHCTLCQFMRINHCHLSCQRLPVTWSLRLQDHTQKTYDFHFYSGRPMTFTFTVGDLWPSLLQVGARRRNSHSLPMLLCLDIIQHWTVVLYCYFYV